MGVQPSNNVVLVCDKCGRKQVAGSHIASMGCRFCGKSTYGGLVDNMGRTEYRSGWEGGWMYPEETSEP